MRNRPGLVAAVGLVVISTAPLLSSGPPQRIYWTDRGILQYGTDPQGVVPGTKLIRISSPPNAGAKTDSEWAKWSSDQAREVQQKVRAASSTGSTGFEVLSIQDVNILDHLTNGEKERIAERFTEAVAKAISDVKQGTGAEVVGILGSNGTRTVSTVGLDLLGQNKLPLDRAIFVDGRARPEDVADTCLNITCTIITDRGDFLSSDRIANTRVAERLVDDSQSLITPVDVGVDIPDKRNIRLLQVDQQDSGSTHIGVMKGDIPVKVREYLGGGRWGNWKAMNSSELLREAALPPAKSTLTIRSPGRPGTRSSGEALHLEVLRLKEEFDSLWKQITDSDKALVGCLGNDTRNIDRCYGLHHGAAYKAANERYQEVAKLLSRARSEETDQIIRQPRKQR